MVVVSVFFKLISGLMKPSSGNIKIGNVNVGKMELQLMLEYLSNIQVSYLI